MSLLDRLRRARLVRVLLVYLGASWVVIEAADLLQDALSLPEWVVPVAIVLLLAGLVVVGATAWVQGQPATDRAEAAGEVPGDWQVDLPDLAASLRRGRLPHLTWGRAILGGVVAFLALFGLAALLVPGVSGPELLPGDREATEAMEAAPGVAVLPFRITGADLEPWREGMVDLLSRNLDGVGGLRAIDSRTVLARWREVGAGDEADLATALEAARRAGARWALLGVVVEVGPSVRVAADLYEVEGGRRVEGAIAEGAADSVLRLVDELSADVARTLLARQNPDLTGLRISSITTESPAALRAFVEGETRYRRSRFEEALEAYERAVALDSAFALAHFRIASARGWASLPGQLEARAEAYRYRDRLPAREDLMIEAEYLARRGALTAGVALLREGVRRYPDDPELWYQLGDAYLHWGPQLKVTPDDGKTALERAVELDPD
ncbi:MAG: tetratricopeptide repeat protein, partial [Longimicrobiales bacterium]|nr:tetratricopeptide repeat protein [Longimicrobiales bacterium]